MVYCYSWSIAENWDRVMRNLIGSLLLGAASLSSYVQVGKNLIKA